MSTAHLDPCLAYLEAQARNEIHTQRRPFVTISRQSGIRSGEIAEELATWLNQHAQRSDPPWTVFDNNIIEMVLEDMHLPARLASFLPEDAAISIRNMVEESLGLHPNMYEVASKTTETLVRLASLGFCILVGRAGNVVLQNFPQSLHVRLVGDVEKRIHAVAEDRTLTLEQAREVVAHEDGARKRYTHTHFFRDNDDPHIYDIVLNMDRFTSASAARLIGLRLLEVTAAGLASGEDTFAAAASKGEHLSHLIPEALEMAHAGPITDPHPVA